MKKWILFAVMLAGTNLALAQGDNPPDFYVEVGAYGGIAPFTKPGLAKDKGDKNTLPAIWGANFHYNFSDRWQIGLETTVSRWAAKGSVTLDSLSNKSLGTADVDYLYADRIWTVTARGNYVIPMYDQYRTNRSNFYFGIAGGVAFTINNGATTFGQYQNAKGEQFRYLSGYNYESGAGYVLGAQVGWNYYFSEHFGFNVEFAPRFTHIAGIDNRNQSRNSQMDVVTFPVMAGLRVRF